MKWLCVVLALVSAGCETYIEYERTPPEMKALIDACVATGGRALGSIVDTSSFSSDYRLTCTWKRLLP